MENDIFASPFLSFSPFHLQKRMIIGNFGFAELTWHSEVQKKSALSFCISLVYS